MAGTGAQDARLEAIAVAAASVLGETEYHEVRTQDIAARVRLHDSGDGRSTRGRRSAVWVYNEARSRRVLVALAARHAWNEYLAGADRSPGAGEPPTLSAAVGLVSAALLEIARFHRASQFLMRQVGLGIGDIATSEKRPGTDGPPPASWPDSAWGQVAADAYEGRLSVYADYLAPVLLAAARAACPVPEQEARQQARILSDLAFRALLADRDGPLDAVSQGLAAYWFERDLVRLAGPRTRLLLAAERSLAGRAGRDPRAQAAARGTLADLLLDYGALNERSAAAGAERVGLLAGLAGLGDPAGPGLAGTGPAGLADLADLRGLCDAASRQGLALLRLGDLAAARTALELSRAVAAKELGARAPQEAASYVARADHNLAAVALDQGAHAAAAALCAAVLEQRRHWAADGSAPAWRRYTLTAELQAQVTLAAGHPVRAVADAEAVLQDRTARLGADSASAGAARAVLGQALLAAGHPRAARYHLEAARRGHEARAPAFGLAAQRVAADLCRAALALGEPALAGQLLPPEEEVGWIEAHASRRLAAAVRGLRAIALARCGQPGAADLAAAASASFAAAAPGPADPVLLDLDRVRAEISWRDGDPVGAAAVLDGVRAAEPLLDEGAFSVGAALTLRQLARCADATGDRAGAMTCYAELRGAADGVLDPAHVVLLCADLDQARRLLGAADIDGAACLVTGVLDRQALAHGRPALEDGHPLLAAARRLAGEIGVPAGAEPDQDWDEE